ncbi:class I SAM-dependent methyltransferase [Actinoplanes subtropicus]|uniref:class I SAM-dependent methyltransferase n=1 Tax=Actinoplanes subtropicus TaxID=543632 RepID=UPI00068DC92F|nr:class I SAM-dependent methyltransferase [Actinoplanes subtropicus]
MTTRPKVAVDLTGTRVTALVTLYLRWLDSREKHPILGDPWAARVVQGLDFDFASLRSWAMDAGRFNVAVRTRILDEWVAAYLAGHPGAVVLDLGCGLDSRVFRIDPPPGCAWFDVDLPEVIAVRDQLYPARAGHTSIGASADEPAWLAGVPADRPVVAVADTLLMWLSKEQVGRLIRQVVEHFPDGELVVNAYSRAVKQRLDRRPGPVFGKYGAVMGWTIEEPEEVELFDDRLGLAEERSQLDPRLLARSPLPYRLMFRLVNAVPAWRHEGRVLKYAWSTDRRPAARRYR